MRWQEHWRQRNLAPAFDAAKTNVKATFQDGSLSFEGALSSLDVSVNTSSTYEHPDDDHVNVSGGETISFSSVALKGAVEGLKANDAQDFKLQAELAKGSGSYEAKNGDTVALSGSDKELGGNVYLHGKDFYYNAKDDATVSFVLGLMQLAQFQPGKTTTPTSSPTVEDTKLPTKGRYMGLLPASFPIMPYNLDEFIDYIFTMGKAAIGFIEPYCTAYATADSAGMTLTLNDANYKSFIADVKQIGSAPDAVISGTSAASDEGSKGVEETIIDIIKMVLDSITMNKLVLSIKTEKTGALSVALDADLALNLDMPSYKDVSSVSSLFSDSKADATIKIAGLSLSAKPTATVSLPDDLDSYTDLTPSNPE